MTRKKTSTARPATVADDLLNAHVAFVLDQLRGPQLQALIEAELDAALGKADKLTLNTVVDRQSIKDSIQVFAVDLRLQGGIPELVGEIARAIHTHKVLDRTSLNDLLSDKIFVEMLNKALELKPLRERLIHGVVSSPPFLAVASDLVYQGIKGYLAENPVTRNIPGAQSMMKLGKAMMSKAAPGLDHSLDESLQKYIRQSVKTTARASARFVNRNLAKPATRKSVHSLWDQIKHTRISTLRDESGISGLDIEEIFVILYEYWHELRQTGIYRALIHAGVDHFFDKYGEASLRDLLEDIGITRDMMLAEALRYAPGLLKGLQRQDLLEPVIRRNLERFYRSAAAESVLAGYSKQGQAA